MILWIDASSLFVLFVAFEYSVRDQQAEAAHYKSSKDIGEIVYTKNDSREHH